MAFAPLAPFTGSAYADAGDQIRNYLASQGQQIRSDIAGAQGTGIDALKAGQTGAIGAIAPAIAQGRTDISGGVDPAIRALYGGQDLASLALGGSVNPAIAALTGGVGGVQAAYSPLLTAAQQYGQYGSGAGGSVADALGINGPEGIQRAQSQFQAGPGFQFALNTGLDALTRSANAAAGGNAAGGNLYREAQTYGQGLGQQEWNNYISNLMKQAQTYSPLEASALGQYGAGVGNAALTGGTGAANIYTGTGGRLADLFSGTGKAAAPVYTGAASSLADLAKTGGLAEGNVYTGTGGNIANLVNSLAGLQVGATTKLAEPYASTYGAQAQAETQGPLNLANLIGQGATFAAGGGFLPSMGPGGLQFGQAYGPSAPKQNTIFNFGTTG